MRIEINNFEDVQSYQERFNIPFAASISKWAIEVLNGFYLQGETLVELKIHKDVLPLSYQTSSQMWVNNTLKKRCDYPHLQSFKRNDYIFLRGSTYHNSPIFIHQLVENLRENTKVTIRKSDVPISYQLQPHTLLHRLRKYGFVKLKHRIVLNKLFIITHVCSKKPKANSLRATRQLLAA